MTKKCDVCSNRDDVQVIPIEIEDNVVSYIQVCRNCLPRAFQLILHELITVEKDISVREVTREEILINLINHISKK